jgi:hypothetical protein
MVKFRNNINILFQNYSSAPGFDPSNKVETLAKDMNVKLITVAIGSAEGFK